MGELALHVLSEHRKRGKVWKAGNNEGTELQAQASHSSDELG